VTISFYFAIGAAYRFSDLEVALATGQRHFLVPAGSLAARRLRDMANIHVALDSGAFPPGNPHRISLSDYWNEILSWRRGAGDWGNLDWFASYDHIGNAALTLRDEQLLHSWIARDAPDAPLLNVVGFCMPVHEAAARILAHPLPGQTRPSYAIGGLAVQRYSDAAEAWYTALLDALEDASDEQLAGVRLHLFGIGKGAWVLRSTSGLVSSFDSSGPSRMAALAGWNGIAARYSPLFGISVEKLQCSRSARLSYHLARYRRAVGLNWNRLDESCFEDDTTSPLAIQHALDFEEQSLLSELAATNQRS